MNGRSVSQIKAMDNDLLRRVLRAENLPYKGTPQLIPSESNEVWRFDDMFVRICYRGDRERLFREAKVAHELPREIGYPEVLAVGRNDSVSWMVTRALDAIPVSEVFPSLVGEERVRIGKRLGELLRIVHLQIPPAGIDTRLGVDIAGEDMYPLPVSRASMLVEELARSGRIDASLAREVTARLDENAFLDPFVGATRLVHCDAGIENLLWRDGEVVGLIDFEMSRSGQNWVDVLPILHGGNIDLARGLRDVYPEPFLLSDAVQRIYLLKLVIALRSAVLWRHPRNVKRLEAIARSPGLKLNGSARELLG